MTPSELMFGRLIKSKVDLVKPDLNTRVENKQFQQKSQHSGGGNNVQKFYWK